MNNLSRNFVKIFILFILISFTCNAQGFICAIGGGTENYDSWSDKPYSWIVEKAGNGKIIILSYSSGSSWLQNYFKSFGASEAENLIVDSKSKATLQSVYDKIVSADAVFIRGGDQYKYFSYYKGTLLEEAIIDLYNSGGVIAGTSAGAMILSEVVFTAKYGSVYPDDALENVITSKIALDDNFLGLMPNTLFDTHFIERGRIGRLIPFLANYYFNTGYKIIGCGIDDRTAICIDSTFVGTVYGSGAATIIEIDEKTNLYIDNGKYEIENLRCDMLTSEWKYNFKNNEIVEFPSSAKSVSFNDTFISPDAEITVSGSNELNDNDNYSIKYFLENNDINNLLLIYNDSYSDSDKFKTYLLQKSVSFSEIVLSENSFNDEYYKSLINAATSIILLGDDLELISNLRNSETKVGSAFNESLSSSVPIIAVGNAGKTVSSHFIGNTDDHYLASYRGRLTNNDGIGLLKNILIQPITFNEDDFFENRVSALNWGLAKNKIGLGVYLSGKSFATFTKDNNIRFSSMDNFIIVDARDTDKTDSSTFIMNNGISPRQVVAMNSLRLSLSNDDKIYSIDDGTLIEITSIKDESKPLLSEFKLYQSYPNPFNNHINLSFYNPRSQIIKIALFDLLGQELEVIASENFGKGEYTINYKLNDYISSGVYFIRYNLKNKSITQKMIYQK